jgi:hypothetical protein
MLRCSTFIFAVIFLVPGLAFSQAEDPVLLELLTMYYGTADLTVEKQAEDYAYLEGLREEGYGYTELLRAVEEAVADQVNLSSLAIHAILTNFLPAKEPVAQQPEPEQRSPPGADSDVEEPQHTGEGQASDGAESEGEESAYESRERMYSDTGVILRATYGGLLSGMGLGSLLSGPFLISSGNVNALWLMGYSPLWMGLGVPTLIASLVGAGRVGEYGLHERGYAARARFARSMAAPFSAVGAVAFTLGATLVFEFAENGEYYPAVGMITGIGLTYLLSGIILTADGNAAVRKLREGYHEYGINQKAGIGFLAAAGAGMFALPIVASVGLTFDDQPVALTTLTILTVANAAAGAALLATGITRSRRHRQIDERSHGPPAAPALQILGVAPGFDPRTNRVGLALQGRFR